MRGETSDIIAAVERDRMKRACELLARAHALLEMGGPPAKKLPEEIADFLGWDKEEKR